MDAWRRLDKHSVPVNEIPIIVAEVISPSESALNLSRKIDAYLQRGLEEVWTTYPDQGVIEVNSGNDSHRYRSSDILEPALLPGWSLKVSDSFDAV